MQKSRQECMSFVEAQTKQSALMKILFIFMFEYPLLLHLARSPFIFQLEFDTFPFVSLCIDLRMDISFPALLNRFKVAGPPDQGCLMMLQYKQCQDFRTLNSCQLCCRVCPASYKSPHYSHSLLQHSHNHTQYVLHNWCDGAFNLLVVLICIF